jgi:7-keto-8-aminopelargonate synthetase-like enzyme
MLRSRLRGHIDRVRPGHPSPIIPVIIGSAQATLQAAAALLDEGFLVPAIRPPTVPAGTSRLRVTVSAAHTDSQVAAFAAALARLTAAIDAPSTAPSEGEAGATDG